MAKPSPATTFVQAMADANPASPLAQHLDAFKRWYSQAGTPRVQCQRACMMHRHETYTLTLSPKLPSHRPAKPARNSPSSSPSPWAAGWPDGSALPLQLQGAQRRHRAHLGAAPRRASVDLHRHHQPAHPFAAAQLERPRRAGLPVHRGRTAHPAGPRQRCLQPLGSRTAPELAHRYQCHSCYR